MLNYFILEFSRHCNVFMFIATFEPLRQQCTIKSSKNDFIIEFLDVHLFLVLVQFNLLGNRMCITLSSKLFKKTIYYISNLYNSR